MGDNDGHYSMEECFLKNGLAFQFSFIKDKDRSFSVVVEINDIKYPLNLKIEMYESFKKTKITKKVRFSPLFPKTQLDFGIPQEEITEKYVDIDIKIENYQEELNFEDEFNKFTKKKTKSDDVYEQSVSYSANKQESKNQSLKRPKVFGINETSLLSAIVTILFKNKRIKKAILDTKDNAIAEELQKVFRNMINGNGELSMLREKIRGREDVESFINILSESIHEDDLFKFFSGEDFSSCLMFTKSVNCSLDTIMTLFSAPKCLWIAVSEDSIRSNCYIKFSSDMKLKIDERNVKMKLAALITKDEKNNYCSYVVNDSDSYDKITGTETRPNNTFESIKKTLCCDFAAEQQVAFLYEIDTSGNVFTTFCFDNDEKTILSINDSSDTSDHEVEQEIKIINVDSGKAKEYNFVTSKTNKEFLDFLSKMNEYQKPIFFVPYTRKAVWYGSHNEGNTLSDTIGREKTICYSFYNDFDESSMQESSVFFIKIIENDRSPKEKYIILDRQHQIAKYITEELLLEKYSVIEGTENKMERVLRKDDRLNPTKKYYLQDLSNFKSNPKFVRSDSNNTEFFPRAFDEIESVYSLIPEGYKLETSNGEYLVCRMEIYSDSDVVSLN